MSHGRDAAPQAGFETFVPRPPSFEHFGSPDAGGGADLYQGAHARGYPPLGDPHVMPPASRAMPSYDARPQPPMYYPGVKSPADGFGMTGGGYAAPRGPTQNRGGKATSSHPSSSSGAAGGVGSPTVRFHPMPEPPEFGVPDLSGGPLAQATPPPQAPGTFGWPSPGPAPMFVPSGAMGSPSATGHHDFAGGVHLAGSPITASSGDVTELHTAATAAAAGNFFASVMQSLRALRRRDDAGPGGWGFGPGGGSAAGYSSAPQPLHQTRFGYPEDDLPLLEELGIFPAHIRLKATAVLNPFKRMSAEAVEDTDLAGPVVFAISLATLLSLQGKVQFSAIYGLSVIGIAGCKALLALMDPSGGTPVAGASIGRPSGTSVPLQFVVSTLGYCLLPHLLLAAFQTTQYWLIGKQKHVTLPVSLIIVVWSAWCATTMFVRALAMERQRFLVLYPMCLFYSTFAALTIF